MVAAGRGAAGATRLPITLGGDMDGVAIANISNQSGLFIALIADDVEITIDKFGNSEGTWWEAGISVHNANQIDADDAAKLAGIILRAVEIAQWLDDPKRTPAELQAVIDDKRVQFPTAQEAG